MDMTYACTHTHTYTHTCMHTHLEIMISDIKMPGVIKVGILKNSFQHSNNISCHRWLHYLSICIVMIYQLGKMVCTGWVQGTVIARGFNNYWIIIRPIYSNRGSLLSLSKLQLGVTVKPLNKGRIKFWGQYKLSYCVLCREIFLFSEVQMY